MFFCHMGIFSISGRQHMCDRKLVPSIIPSYTIVRCRRKRYAGRCVEHPKDAILSVALRRISELYDHDITRCLMSSLGAPRNAMWHQGLCPYLPGTRSLIPWPWCFGTLVWHGPIDRLVGEIVPSFSRELCALCHG